MFVCVRRFLLLLVIVLPAVIQFAERDSVSFVLGDVPPSSRVAEDPIDGDDVDVEGDDGDDGEGHVETEESVDPSGTTATSADSVVLPDEDYDVDDAPLKPSPDADTHFLFVKPTGIDLPAGVVVNFVVGFTNRGPLDFTLTTLDASFRYPMDFSYHIYNFSTVQYARLVKPKQQATLSYSFLPSESFSARPFGLVVNLNYRDSEGNHFMESVFNDTVNIVELEDGLDGETVFLYVFMAACVALLFVVGQQLLATYGGQRKRPSKPKPVERGTSNPNDVDYDWLPKETLDLIRKGNVSPRRSPRQRHTRRSTGVDD